MKAIIMAGGEGTRLKAVSGDTPKPLVPLCGRPVMEHIVSLLRENGITEICAALKYRPEAIQDYFGDGERFGVTMQYRIEEEALGTAGGVKNCEDFYGNEDFLVISGDAACDLALSQLVQAHKERSPAVTLALYPHPEPLRYGLALCDGDSCVRAFIEKPEWPRVVTNLVNTGIYVISPRAMELVPKGENFDFAKDLFPLLLEKKEKILGLTMDGYWCDIGTPLSYYECCADAICGRLRISLGEGFAVKREENGGEETDAMCRESVPCRDRAKLMDTLSCAFLDLGAEYSDGLCFRGTGYELRIAPLPDAAALRICANARDTETARELVTDACAIVRELEKRLDN